MQGIYVNNSRPKSKKAVKDAVAFRPDCVYIEATSLFGNEYQGAASELPAGARVSFVGPDPYTSRKFYGTIKRAADGSLKVGWHKTKTRAAPAAA